jgi:conjugative transfer signal peptidase TraF
VRRAHWLATTLTATLGAGLTVLVHPAPKWIWNASASVPIGLYAVHPTGALHLGELLVVAPPEPLAAFLAGRGYLPKRVPLLKHVLALPGHQVCRTARAIAVDGVAVGEAQDRDLKGRALPVWKGCRVIAAGEVFLMNRRSVDSLDGRYFGALPDTAIIGRADPVWMRPAP